MGEKLYQKVIDAFAKIPQGPYDQGLNGLLQISYCYARSGDKIKANELLEKISLADRQESPVLMGNIYLSKGDTSKALYQLEYSYEIRTINIVYLAISSTLSPLKNEPRFQTLLKKMNFN